MASNAIAETKSLHVPAAYGEPPEGWTWSRLDDVSEGVFDCPQSTPKLTESGPFVVRTQDIITGVFRADQAGYVSEETYAERIARVTPSRGDLRYSREGTYFGIAAEVPAKTRVCLGQRMVLIRPDKRRLDFGFLRHWLNSPIMAAHIHGYRDGSVAERLNLPTICALPVLLPPLAEQKAIAAVLGALDDKIELNRRMNATLEAMARALFQSWFIDFDPVRRNMDRNQPSPRPSGHPSPSGRRAGDEGAAGLDFDPVRASRERSGRQTDRSEVNRAARQPTGLDPATAALFPDHLEDSPLGHIPKGWKAGTVNDAFKLTMGQSPPGDTYNQEGNGIPFYQGCTDFGFRFPTRRVFCTAPTRYAKAGDTLVSVRAPVGDINMANEDCCIGRGVAAIRHKTGAKSFTYHAMANLEPDFARFEAEGTVFGSINKQNFENLRFVIPPPEIVAAYERQAAPLDEQIYNLEHQSRTLATLRDTLLPKLLSGELSVAEIQTTAI